MLLLLHIIIAVASIAYTTYLFIAPSTAKLRTSYSLVAATIASGTFLVIINPAHIVQACMAGLLYICVILVAIVAAQRKLAKQEI